MWEFFVLFLQLFLQAQKYLKFQKGKQEVGGSSGRKNGGGKRDQHGGNSELWLWWERVGGPLGAGRIHPLASKEPERCKFSWRSEITPGWKSQSAAKPQQPHRGTR